jgi:N-acetylglucosamine-6-phosphate deacetylase
MSMHLEGPWLSTTGKRRGKQKFRNAAEARKARELQESWEALQKKWGIDAQEKKRKQAMNACAAAGTLSPKYRTYSQPQWWCRYR